MGHFTINLPDNRLGEVRWGKVRRLHLPFLWPSRKVRDEKTGYIIKVTPAIGERSEYRLFKTKEGQCQWFQDTNERTPVEDEMALAIKKAIERHKNMIP